MQAFAPDSSVTTQRLLLRPFAPSDAGRVRSVIEARASFLPPGAPDRSSGVSRWLAQGVHELRRSGQGTHLAMEADGLVVGAISLFRTLWDAGTTEIGYGVHPLHRGRGYAPEAVRGLTRWAFDSTALHRIELRANLDNVASLRVAEKAGFVREGVLRLAAMEKDGPRDVVVFGLLRSDLS
ncbi:GNAT family N-acetyltransferase [Streptosporangium carneum]|uniref:N-acetyltransferase GCN5 n=1 Tax=Streptosporangium carneum TaxID=47481 RepID=A0A9W6MFU0_9ACTN|nr:GNAT family protein [Streptosporangium carneum]GLK12415.1 N-acetyltransferase GCN5 [Streptosporangium carneum]